MENVIDKLKKELEQAKEQFINDSIINKVSSGCKVPDTSYSLEYIIELIDAINLINREMQLTIESEKKITELKQTITSLSRCL